MGVRVKVSKVRNSPGPEVLKCNHTKKVEVLFFYYKQRLRPSWVLRDLILSSSTIDKKLENFDFIFEFKIAINLEFIFEIFVNFEFNFEIFVNFEFIFEFFVNCR